jgi:alkyl hydroperoxide reductase subunit AhpC
MTTLSLGRRADYAEPRFTVSLQDWLHDKWGLLFSHPADFALTDLETDRWLAVVANAFAQRNIRAIALESGRLTYGSNWISHLHGYETAVYLDSAPESYSDETEFNAIVLSSAITRAPSRFVMAIDANLRLRRTFAYSQGDRVPSVLDFAAMIDKLAQPQRPSLESVELPRYVRAAAERRIAAHIA